MHGIFKTCCKSCTPTYKKRHFAFAILQGQNISSINCLPLHGVWDPSYRNLWRRGREWEEEDREGIPFLFPLQLTRHAIYLPPACYVLLPPQHCDIGLSWTAACSPTRDKELPLPLSVCPFSPTPFAFCTFLCLLPAWHRQHAGMEHQERETLPPSPSLSPCLSLSPPHTDRTFGMHATMAWLKNSREGIPPLNLKRNTCHFFAGTPFLPTSPKHLLFSSLITSFMLRMASPAFYLL